MTTLHTQALLLRASDFGESDRILQLLTPATGRISVIAKGARRSVKRFGGNLDLFNQLRVQIERRRPQTLARLELARLVGAFHGLRTHPQRFALACYLLEVLSRLAPEGGSRAESERLFRFAASALAWLDASEPTPATRPLLEFRTLDAVGLRPELGRCVRCGARLGQGDGPRVAFLIGDGGPRCARCRTPGEAGFSLQLGTLRALETSLDFELRQLDRIVLGQRATDEAQRLLQRFLRFHVGPELRSERFLARLGPRGSAAS